MFLTFLDGHGRRRGAVQGNVGDVAQAASTPPWQGAADDILSTLYLDIYIYYNIDIGIVNMFFFQ